MTVRGHLFRLVIAVLAPTALLAGLLLYQVVDASRAASKTALLNVARSVSRGVDTEVQRSITALQVLATSYPLRSGDLSAFREQLETARRVHGRWSNVLVFAPDGRRLVNLRVPPGGEMPVGKDTTHTMRAVAERRPQVSDVIVSPTSGKAAVYVAVPVVVEDNVRCVLVATMEFDQWTELLAEQLPAGWVAAIDDRQGVIFARSERPEAFVGKEATAPVRARYANESEGIAKNRNREGLEIYAGFATSTLTGWHTLAIVPAAVIDGPVWRTLAWLGVGSVAVFAIAMLLAFRVARPLSTSIARLKSSVVKLARLETPPLMATSIDEIDEVNGAIVIAARKLSAQAAHLQTLQTRLADRAEAAEAASRAKDEFLGMLGHELRNPLAAISGANAVLLMQLQGEMRQMPEIIQRQTRNLTSVVDDLLDVSRAAAGKLKVHACDLDLAEVVRQVREAFEAAGRFREHALAVDVEPVRVRADPDRMVQVVRNLLDNALKYTPPGGRVTVRTWAEGASAVLVVEDTGQGIDPALLPRVFDPFVQAPQAIDRQFGGLGLGLAIVRQIVELQGGTVQAFSDGAGTGARFVVRLPLVETHAAPPDTAIPAGRPRADLRIAVIEDHDDVRRGLVAILRGDGHEVEEAADGSWGVSLLERGKFDVAFVDIGLPGASGYEVVRRARAAGAGCHFIALTGYGQTEDRVRAAEAGFDSFLVKPVSLDDVRRELASVALDVTRAAD